LFKFLATQSLPPLKRGGRWHEVPDEGIIGKHYLFLILPTLATIAGRMCAFAFIFVQQTAVKEGILKGKHGFPLSLLLCLLSCRSKKVSVTEVCAYDALDSNRLILNVPPARLKLSTAEGR
jgi:hypothetical protein